MIIPRPNNIVVKPLFDPDISPGGIIIPDMAKERADQGIVKYVGNATKLCKVGDWILFSGYSGQYFEIDGEGSLITMHERLVIAVIGPAAWADKSVSGLYCMDKEGNVFPASYNVASELMTHAISEHFNAVRFGNPTTQPDARKVDFRPDMKDMEVDTNWTDHE